MLPSAHDSIHKPSVKTAPKEFVELPLNDLVMDLQKNWTSGSLRRSSGQIGMWQLDRYRRGLKVNKSPTFVAYKANLNALQEIRRQYLGQRGCITWITTLDISTGIIMKVSEWCKIVQGLEMARERKKKAALVDNHDTSTGLLAYS